MTSPTIRKPSRPHTEDFIGCEMAPAVVSGPSVAVSSGTVETLVVVMIAAWSQSVVHKSNQEELYEDLLALLFPTCDDERAGDVDVVSSGVGSDAGHLVGVRGAQAVTDSTSPFSETTTVCA